MTRGLSRAARLAPVVAFAASAILLLGSLPLDSMMDALHAWIEGLGSWAPLVYAVAYGLAATLFVPGSALSLAAGVLFGLWIGTAAVWSGATLAIVLSFLIARHGARSRVEALAQSRPRFAAVDRAVGEQGWKIVALMRLSPAFPFSLQNYLFGITAIRFWPCCLASSAFILPGTFLYVYLGYAGGKAAAAVGTGGSTANLVRLGLQVVGLLATVVVTVLVARIAAQAIRKHVPEETPESESAESAPADGEGPAVSGTMLVIALACLLASSFAFLQREAIRDRLFPAGNGQDRSGITAPSRLPARPFAAGRFAPVRDAMGFPEGTSGTRRAGRRLG